MRRYLQGTLDFACGIYAIINALACTHGIELGLARRIFQETLETLSLRQDLFIPFCRNATDHYWLVRYMLQTANTRYGFELELLQPFSNCLLPASQDTEALPALPELYLPEKEEPWGPPDATGAREEAEAVWRSLSGWLEPQAKHKRKRAALFRFHRFLPSIPQPVVSHWTTGKELRGELLSLHDASSEKGALLEIQHQALLPFFRQRALLRIVPESIVLIRG